MTPLEIFGAMVPLRTAAGVSRTTLPTRPPASYGNGGRGDEKM